MKGTLRPSYAKSSTAKQRIGNELKTGIVNEPQSMIYFLYGVYSFLSKKVFTISINSCWLRLLRGFTLQSNRIYNYHILNNIFLKV